MDPAVYPVALSSWAVHKAIGFDVEDGPDKGPQPYRKVGPDPIDVRDLPAIAAAHGFRRVELCHFHFDRRDPSVVRDLKATLAAEGVVLQTLLIDNGDLAHPDKATADKHEAWIASWLETGEALGAERARVVGGRTRREGDIKDVAPRLKRLAAGTSVRITTENWLATLDRPSQILGLLDLCEGAIGLNVDLGNWTGPENLQWIEEIAGRAETCHAKCEVVDGENDLEDFGQAIDAVVRGGYKGPLTLVNGAGSNREWQLVLEQSAFIRSRS
jgi:sugar phosphate isomerase/epimerase